MCRLKRQHWCAQESTRTNCFLEAEELLRNDSCPDFTELLPLVSSQLSCICEVKKAGNESFYRYSRERVHAWLRCKLTQTLSALAAMKPCPLPPSDEASKAYAAGMLCEYLSAEWAQELLQGVSPCIVSASSTPLPSKVRCIWITKAVPTSLVGSIISLFFLVGFHGMYLKIQTR